MAGIESSLVGALGGAVKGGSGLGKSNKQDDDLPSYHKGGKVKRTGPANLEKGEVVLSRKQAGKRRKKGKSKRGAK